MSKLERITITMPEEMAARLQSAVDSGEYATTSEIVREAIRAWGAAQDLRSAEIERIRQLVEEARSSPLLDGPTAMATLRDKFAVQSA